MASLKRTLSISPPPANKRKIQSTTTKNAVNAFFRPASQKEPERTTWRIVNKTLLVARYQPLNSSESTEPQAKRRKIAAFDFDSTLIVSASGNRFGRDATDWKWWNPVVPGRLRTLYEEGYQIIIFSNQAGINLRTDSKSANSDSRRLAEFKSKVGSVLNQLDLPISLYGATERDQYRKPRLGMWYEMVEDYDLEAAGSVDLEGSFFVGDAGGRVGSGSSGVRRDHSCSDRDFAFNVGVAFRTPEEFFLEEETKLFARDFDPTHYMKQSVATPENNAASVVISKTNTVDIMMLCGSPGAGKSTFYWRYLQPLGYERVNQDILKTRERCLKVASEFIAKGSSVAVDNTNADPDTRIHWVKLAQRFSIPIRCVLFTASPKLGEHNDAVRALNGVLMNPEQREMLPKVAFAGFSSRYREPTLKEGFQDIVKVNFKFEGNEEQRAVWSKYWI